MQAERDASSIVQKGTASWISFVKSIALLAELCPDWLNC
jgi:hypothetical protein